MSAAFSVSAAALLALTACGNDATLPPTSTITVYESPTSAAGSEQASEPTNEPGPTAAEGDDSRAPSDGTLLNRAYVLGDSLTFKAQEYMDQAMKDQGWTTNPATDSRIGRSVEEGLSLLADEPDLPETVLVALGTNSWTASASEAADWIRQTREIIGPNRRLIWVNVQMDGERFQTYLTVNMGLVAGAASDNEAQSQAGATGRTYIADWAQFSADQRIPHNHDGVHYKAGGYQQRMAFYAGILAQAPPYGNYIAEP